MNKEELLKIWLYDRKGVIEGKIHRFLLVVKNEAVVLN